MASNQQLPCQSLGLRDTKILKKAKMTLDKETRNCLICNVKLGATSRNSVAIFGANALTSLCNPIINIINSSLQQSMKEENSQSSIICKKCFKLVNEVDELEYRSKQIKQELCNLFKKTADVKVLEDTKNNDEIVDHDYIENIENLEIKTIGREAKKKGKKVMIVEVPEFIEPKEIVTEEAMETNEAIKEESCLKEEDAVKVCSDQMNSDFHNGNDNDNNNVDEDNENGDKYVVFLDNSSQVEEVLIEDENLKKRNEKISAATTIEYATKFENGYKCSMCLNDEKRDSKSIVAHIKTVHNFRLYICDMCGDMFKKRTDHAHHVDEHMANEKGDYQCEWCNRIFNNLRLFRIHRRIHSPQTKSWSCEHCDKRYSSRNLLNEHMNTHTGVRPHVCEVCKKGFTSKYTYRSHLKVHQDRPRPFQCPQCKKKFLSQQNLTQHMKTHNGIKDYICNTCGKAFGSAHNLEVHNIVHTGQKPYICEKCGKAFARKAEIRDHERTHTGEKPYQCEFCGATFSQRSNLQSHKRATHYNDKRYKCEDCGKGFKRRRLLDYHTKAAHTGERPHQCTTCSATFVYPEHYKKHMRIHTGEKPYLCEVCGKAFNSRDNRNAHRFIHSDKKPYECLNCGAGFMRKPLLYAHMQSQGHLNDTIVVNQPRLTTEEEVVLQDNGRIHLVVQGDENQLGENTHMILAELKDNQVIIQDGDQQKILSLTGSNVASEEISQIVYDGQMNFETQSAVIECKQEDENESIDEVYGYQDEEGNTIILPRGTNIKELLEQGSKEMQFVQIRLPSKSDTEGTNWIEFNPDP